MQASFSEFLVDYKSPSDSFVISLVIERSKYAKRSN
jgi:hypothetical protein